MAVPTNNSGFNNSLQNGPAPLNGPLGDRIPNSTNSHMQELLAKSEKSGKTVSIFDILNASKLDKTLSTRPKVGDMVIFQYQAVNHENLPYWDRFPIIFITDIKDEYIHGINLHYLPTIWRKQLLGNLKPLANNQRYDDTTRLRLSYNVLQSASRYKAFKPCFKEYVYRGVKSRFIKIHPTEWDVAVLLPVARFQKKPARFVQQESVKQIRQDTRNNP